MWQSCREGAEAGDPSKPPQALRGLRGNGRHLCNYQAPAFFQICILPPLARSPGFPSNPKQASNTREVSSSSYNTCPSSPPLARKTKSQPLWGPERKLCEVNPVLPILFHSGNQLFVWRGPSTGDVLVERSTISHMSWSETHTRISPEVHRPSEFSGNLVGIKTCYVW